jgi:peptidoglycan hydrolase-like protein with peptidoglycan-binding domain
VVVPARLGIRRRLLILIAGAGLLAISALAGAAFLWSGATLTNDPTALARLHVETFGGKLVSVSATGADGHSVPLTIERGRLSPRTPVTPGEAITVDVVMRRPGWLGWALGERHREQLTVHATVAAVGSRWLTLPMGSRLEVRFDQPVTSVSYGPAGQLRRHALPRPSTSVVLPRTGSAGSVQVAAAARSWERLGTPVTVSWFPPSRRAAALASPSVGASTSPLGRIRLTFSKKLDKALGSERPRISPGVAGQWSEPDSHTLVFTPSGFGAGLGANVRMTLPRPVQVAGRETRQLEWKVPAGSTKRLQQLLAGAGYLPLKWKPADGPVNPTWTAQLEAAVSPPDGQLPWRYGHTPPELRRLWNPGQPNTITRGAVMMFQEEHHLTVDGIAGRDVWHALIADTIAGKRRHAGYSYVYVHRGVPQSLTLWHNGRQVLRSPGNTGVPAAPTKLGTFPVFEHIPVGTMSGTNPDGTHYRDPGIRYISYFNGGDAIHSFNRASFGTPQSLGCVELPLASARKVWPYTPIGTLVTVEN